MRTDNFSALYDRSYDGKADLNQNLKVFEIRTRSGYQAAILGEICKEVYSLEATEQLANPCLFSY